MTWLDIFIREKEIRPARPARENDAGRPQHADIKTLSSTSSTSSTENAIGKTTSAKEATDTEKREGFLSLEDCYQTDPPSKLLLDNIRRLMVPCPVEHRKLHCWYCSRCPWNAECNGYREGKYDLSFEVERYKKAEEPDDLLLAEKLGKWL